MRWRREERNERRWRCEGENEQNRERTQRNNRDGQGERGWKWKGNGAERCRDGEPWKARSNGILHPGQSTSDVGNRAKKVGIQLRECAVCATWLLSERSKTEHLGGLRATVTSHRCGLEGERIQCNNLGLSSY